MKHFKKLLLTIALFQIQSSIMPMVGHKADALAPVGLEDVFLAGKIIQTYVAQQNSSFDKKAGKIGGSGAAVTPVTLDDLSKAVKTVQTFIDQQQSKNMPHPSHAVMLNPIEGIGNYDGATGFYDQSEAVLFTTNNTPYKFSDIETVTGRAGTIFAQTLHDKPVFAKSKSSGGSRLGAAITYYYGTPDTESTILY